MSVNSQKTEPAVTSTPTPPVGPPGTSTARAGSAMTAAKAPVGTGPAPLVALLLALGLIALGVVGIQEALVRSGATTGTSWTTWVLTRLDGVTPADWMLVVFVIAAIVGILLLLIAFRRRPRKTLAVRATTGVYLRTRDLARLADHHLDGIDGITDVNTAASGNRLRVTATTLEPKARNTALSDTLRERLAPCLEALEPAPKVSVSIRNGDLT